MARNDGGARAVSALTIVAALSLAQSCAPSVAPDTLLAFSRPESALDPGTIHSNRPPCFRVTPSAVLDRIAFFPSKHLLGRVPVR
jgi:hypothetical protein